MNNKLNKKNNDNKDCLWDCKVGLFLMVFFPFTMVYIYTKHSKYYQNAKKKDSFFNIEDYFYFRYLFYFIGMTGIIMAVLVAKMLSYFTK